MARTLRVFYGQQRSGWQRINWGIRVDAFPVVHISVSEAWWEDYMFDPLSAIHPFKGEATFSVKNVVPMVNPDGSLGVDFYVQIDWPEPLNFCVDITVVESAEQGFDTRP